MKIKENSKNPKSLVWGTDNINEIVKCVNK